MKRDFYLGLFLILGSIHLILISLNYHFMALCLKPLLIPQLFLYVFSNQNFSFKKIVLSALTFSWIGDLLLIFTNNNQWFFISGLLSFLIAHIFYIYLFSKLETPKTHKKNSLFWIGIFLIIFYLITILNLLLPSLGPLKMPVSFYAVTISIMLSFAWRGFISWNNNSRYYILFGAISFIVSDSLLAINKFQAPINNAAILIMLTYLFAQFAIVFGVVKFNNQKQ